MLTPDGQEEYVWNIDSPAEVQAARENFEHYLRKNYIAFRKEAGGKKATPLSRFDPLAEEIFMLGLSAGG